MSYQTQSPPSLRTTLSTAESYDSTDSAIFSIERSAERATTPSATLDDRSISHGIAAVFIEHSRLIPPVQPADRAATHDGDGDSVSSLRIRKRDKIFAYFWPAPSEPQAEAEIEEPLNEKGDIHNAQDSACTTPDQVPSEPDQQGSKEIVASNESSQAESSTDPADTNNTDAKELYSADLPIAYWDVFPQNDDKPSIRQALPHVGTRIDTTLQLALCASLLPKDTDALDKSEGSPQELPTNAVREEWVKAIEQDAVEQDHIRWLVTRMVEEFVKTPIKDSVSLSEIVLLAPVLDREHYRKLLSFVIADFEKSVVLDVELLQSLVQLVRSALHDFLVPDDLVKILRILRTRLEGTHQQSTEHPYHLTLAVSAVLDVMAEHKVEGLDRVVEHEPLSGVLSSLSGSSDPYLMYQATYAFQALQYVPNNESPLQAIGRHALGVAEGVLQVSAVLKLDIKSLLGGLDTLQEVLGSTVEIATTVYQGYCTLKESGRGVFDSIKEGYGTGQKRPWYTALRAAHALVQAGQLKDFNQLICEAPCRVDPLYQWGISQLLGQIALDPMWELDTRKHAVELLGALYRNDPDWGWDESVNAWILTIFSRLEESSEEIVKASAHILLQNLKKDQVPIQRLPYPLRSRLPHPASSPILAHVQHIPYVEYDLHQLQVLRLKEGRQSVYVPPQAKSSLQSPDEDLFPLAEKVQEFLASDRQVMLILGDSGAGKSTFIRHLEHDLWTSYKQGGSIPLLINLPSIDRPDLDMATKQLKIHNFKDGQIHELKQHRQLILICDGYDESQQLVNLHKANMLNQSGQWNTKMIITCRSQYLGPSYHDRFKPLPNDRYASASLDLFQEAVIAPFSIDQVQAYIEQYAQDPGTQRSFGEGHIWTSEEYMEKLKTIPNMMDLVKNPFLLYLTLDALPRVMESNKDFSNIRITRVCLYDKFVEQWMQINLQRLQSGNHLTDEEHAALSLLLDDGFLFNAIRYLKQLSASVFKEQDGHPVVQYSHLRDKGSWKAEFFKPDADVRLLRKCCPLERTGTQYRFVHRSVLEYFFSRAIYCPVTVEAEPTPPEDSEFSGSPLLNPEGPFFQRSLLTEPSVVQFLCDRVEMHSDFKNQLLEVIEHSKANANASTAATNAMTILVKAGVLLDDTDLSEVQVSFTIEE